MFWPVLIPLPVSKLIAHFRPKENEKEWREREEEEKISLQKLQMWEAKEEEGENKLLLLLRQFYGLKTREGKK